MTFCEELYFEITLTGEKSELKKFVNFLKSGELDDFFEFDSDYLDYNDDFDTVSDGEMTGIIFSNDDWGIEIDEFDTDEFLDVFCRAAKNLDVEGRLFDVDDEEYFFVSEEGNSYYTNALLVGEFNEDEDKPREDEDEDEE